MPRPPRPTVGQPSPERPQGFTRRVGHYAFAAYSVMTLPQGHFAVVHASAATKTAPHPQRT
jgi:hypothetical protein